METKWTINKDRIEDTKKRIKRVIFELESLKETLMEYEKEITHFEDKAGDGQKNHRSWHYKISGHITGSIKNKTIECKKTMTRFAKDLPVYFWNYEV